MTDDEPITGTWAADSGCDSTARAGRHARYYSFELGQEREVTVSLESKKDTYLYLREGDARSGAFLHENDDHDSGGLANTTDSQIRQTLAAGTYTIEATTYGEGETGSFTLTIEGLGSTGLPPQTSPQPAGDPFTGTITQCSATRTSSFEAEVTIGGTVTATRAVDVIYLIVEGTVNGQNIGTENLRSGQWSVGDADSFTMSGTIILFGNNITCGASDDALYRAAGASEGGPSQPPYEAEKSGRFSSIVSGLDGNPTGRVTSAFAPWANAGPDHSVPAGEDVVLDASSSRDAPGGNGTRLTYFWQQVSGPPVTLTNMDSAAASFTVPSQPGTVLLFSLTVETSDGRRHADQVTLEVTKAGPVSTPVAQAWAGLSNVDLVVWYFDEGSQKWRFYDPSLTEFSTLAEVVAGDVYLVQVGTSTTVILNGEPRTLTCYRGNCWNMIVW